MVFCTFYTSVCKLHSVECGGHLAECRGHSRGAHTQTGGVAQGTDAASLSIVRALSENANQETEKGNAVDERGKIEKIREVGKSQRNRLAVNRDVWICDRYNREIECRLVFVPEIELLPDT